MSLRIEIDRGRCMGSGNCSFHAPNTFDLDESLKAIVVDPDGDSHDDLRVAAEGCPVDAITVELDTADRDHG